MSHPYNDFEPAPDNPGPVRVPIPESIDYSKHGYWVRHKKTGAKGKICYWDRNEDLVWIWWVLDKRSGASGMPPGDLVLLKNRQPEPWYDFEAIDRRRNV